VTGVTCGLLGARPARVNVSQMKPLTSCGFAETTLCAGLLMLVACTQSADDVKAARAANATGEAIAQATAAKTVTVNSDADMVAAVTDGVSDTPVSVAYRLTARPQLKQPTLLEVAITPDKSVKVLSMHVSIRGGDGLELKSEPRLEIADAGASDVFRESVTVVPQQQGVLQLHLTVLADSSSSSLARSYSIPLLVTP
jgi:hypothetical protein